MTEITFLQGLFLLLFPFVASVAFTLFMRFLDNKSTLVDKIKAQRDILQQTSQEINSIENKMQSLVREMESIVQEKADEIYKDLYTKNFELQDTITEQSERMDQTIESLRNESQKKLAQETESLIEETVSKINSMFQRLDGFAEQIKQNQEYKSKELEM